MSVNGRDPWRSLCLNRPPRTTPRRRQGPQGVHNPTYLFRQSACLIRIAVSIRRIRRWPHGEREANCATRGARHCSLAKRPRLQASLDSFRMPPVRSGRPCHTSLFRGHKASVHHGRPGRFTTDCPCAARRVLEHFLGNDESSWNTVFGGGQQPGPGIHVTEPGKPHQDEGAVPCGGLLCGSRPTHCGADAAAAER